MQQTVDTHHDAGPPPVHRHQIGGFKVSFPLSSVQKHRVAYIRLDLHQKIREHDTAVIRISSRQMDWFRQFNTGTPVRITYWSANNRQVKGTFLGYVSHVRLVTPDDESPDGNQYQRDIVCVAASRDLRATTQTIYRNMTAPEIVTEIGKRFRFKVITKQHDLRRATVTQHGETYWEFLNRLAIRSGYALRVEGTTLFFLPIRDMVRAAFPYAPVLSDYRADKTSKYQVPTVESIDSWVGDSSDDRYRLTDAAIFTSVSPESNIATVQKKPTSAFYRDRESRSKYNRFLSSNTVAHSRTDAEILAQGAADNGLLALDVDLRVAGDPQLSPYQPVELAIRDQALSGYWIVKEVTHTIWKYKDSRYLCDVTLSTDSISGLSRHTPVSRTEKRNLGSESIHGFTDSEGIKSRLAASQQGFVTGTTAAGTTTGRWVHT